jgi:hypothetical protein
MKTKFLTLNKPCDEKWENMTPNERGSFCNSCSKNVIDFTRLSQLEISEIMKKSDGNICARVTSSQLRTPLFNLEDEKKGFRFPYSKVAAGLMLASSLTVGLPACTDSSKVYTVEVATTNVDLKSEIKKNNTKAKKDVSNSFVYFKGKVLAGEKGEPVENAKISLFTISNILTTYTAANGKFVLKIPINLVDIDNVIRVTFDNKYNYEDFILSKKEIETNYMISTKAKVEMLLFGEMGLRYGRNAPIVIYNGAKIKFEEFAKAQESLQSNCNIENDEYYHFDSEAAVAIYGEEAKHGLYILTEKPKVKDK